MVHIGSSCGAVFSLLLYFEKLRYAVLFTNLNLLRHMKNHTRKIFIYEPIS